MPDPGTALSAAPAPAAAPAGAGAPLAVLRDVAGGYGGPLVLEGVTLDVAPGQRIGVLGPNGGGKSTLFRALLGELPVRRGHLEVRGPVGTVPQTERSRLDFPVTALDVALMGALARLPWWRRPGRAERARALHALGRVGLRELAGERFGALSGGQRQRVLIARALVQDAALLLLDEPFAGLDEPSGRTLERLMADLAAEGRGLLIATHDVEQARGWDLVLCLNRRQVAFGPPAEALTRPVLEATYGTSLIPLPGGAGRGIAPPHHCGP
jgi:ABC-type Mn2+/Zn2+ transport system ATPase subunit